MFLNNPFLYLREAKQLKPLEKMNGWKKHKSSWIAS